MNLRMRLRSVLFILAFSLALSTGFLEIFSFLGDTRFPAMFYVLGGVASVLTAFLFAVTFASVRAWNDTEALEQC